uniref:Uncharacterized protein n=1 Tax=Knipowitschia caucasica TaxID=637954 RepID=A0AAV2JIR6_KNICA
MVPESFVCFLHQQSFLEAPHPSHHSQCIPWEPAEPRPGGSGPHSVDMVPPEKQPFSPENMAHYQHRQNEVSSGELTARRPDG